MNDIMTHAIECIVAICVIQRKKIPLLIAFFELTTSRHRVGYGGERWNRERGRGRGEKGE